MKADLLNLLDFNRINTLLEGFNKTTGFVTAILDLDGNILSHSGWRSICTDFHRVNAQTAKKCTISDTELANKMAVGEKFHFYKCLNGLVDVAVPLVVDGEHIANLFSGQFFFEEPDRDLFLQQATKYGFDNEKYLKALAEVPVISEERVKAAMDFLLQMTEMIAEMTLQRMAQIHFSNELKESEEKFRILTENSPDHVIVQDKDLRYTYVLNPQLGLTLNDMIGKTDFDFLKKEEAERLTEIKNKVLKSGESFHFETSLVSKQGKNEYFNGSIIPRKDKNNTIDGVIGYFRNVTEQKNAETSLKDAQSIAHFGNYEIGISEPYVKWSDETFSIFGMDPAKDSEPTVEEYAKFLHPEDKDLLYKHFEESISTKKDFNLEYRIITSDGITKHIHSVGRIKTDKQGNVLSMFGTFHDITESKQAEESLKESQARYKALFEASPDAVLLADRSTGIIAYANHAAEELFETTLDNIIGQHQSQLHPEQQNRKAKESFKNKSLHENQHAEPVEIDIVTALNQIKTVEIRGEIIKLEGKEHVLGTFRDITERQLMEAALKQSELQNRTILQTAMNGFWIVEKDGRFTEVNNAYCELTGYSREELLTMSVPDVEVIDSKTDVLQRIQRLLQNGNDRFETKHRCKNGRIVNVEINISLLKDEEKFCVFISDITERKQAEEALIRSEEQFRSIFNNLQDAFFQADLTGRFTVVSPSALRMYGFDSVDELIGQPAEKLYAEKHVRESLITELQTKGNIEDFVTTGRKKDGSTFRASMNIRFIRNNKNEITGTEGVVRDISDRWRAEEALRESDEQLKSIFDNSLNVIMIADDAGNYLKVNQAAAKMFQYPVEKLLQMKVGDLRTTTTPDAAERYQEYISKGFDIGEFDFIRPDNTLGIAQYHAVRVRENFNLSILSDITERKKIEEDLKESENRFRTIAEHISDGIVVADLEGNYVFVNNAFCTMSGYSKDELLKLKVFDMVSNNQLKGYSYSDKENVSEEKRHIILRKKDGQEYHTEISRTPIEINRQKLILGSVRDITEIVNYQNNLIEAREKAEESESRFREVLENRQDAAYKRNLQTNKYDYLSPVFQEIAGYTQDEINSLPLEKVLDIMYPDDVDEINRVIKQALSNKNHRSYHIEYRFKYKNENRYVWLLDKFNVMYNEHEEPVALIGSVSDITERKKAEQALQESEERFRVAQEMSPDGFSILKPLRNENGDIIDFIWLYENQTIARINGTNPQQVVGKRLLELFPAHSGKAVFETYLKVANNKLTQILEEINAGVILSKPIWLRLVIVSMGDAIAVLAQDITERKLSEEAVRKSEERFALVLDASEQGIWDWNIETNEVFYSEQWKRQIGYEDEELKNDFNTWIDHLHPDESEYCQNAVNSYLNQPAEHFIIEFRFRHKDGTYRWIYNKSSSLKNAEGKVIRMFGTHTDITERKLAEEALFEKEEMMRNSQAVAHICSYSTNLNENEIGASFWKCSPEFYTIFGIDKTYPHTIEGWAGFVHPDYREEMVAYHEYVIKERILFDHEYKIIRINDGVERWVYGTGELELDEKGKPVRMYGAIQDITERKQAEEALKENNLRLQLAMKVANMAWWQLELPSGKVTFENRKAEMLGYAPEEFSHYTDFTNLVHPDDYENAMNAMYRHINGELDKYETEYRILTKTGNYKWFYDIGSIVKRNAEGKPLVITGLVIDISARKQADTILQEIIEKNPISIQIVDTNGFTLQTNAAHTSLFGAVPPPEYSIFKDEQIVSQGFVELLEGVKTGESVRFPDFKFNIHNVYPELPDNPIWLRLVIFPLMDKDGILERYVLMHEDITERKLAEESIKQLNEELELRVARRTEQLESSNKELRSFSYSVSHDLRAPLRAINGFSNILLQDYSPLLDEEGKRLLDVIITNANNMGRLIDDLLAFSRLGQQELRQTEIDMKLMASQVFDESVDKQEASGINFRLLDIPDAWGDPSMMRQVWINLIGNAVKFTSKKQERVIEIGHQLSDESCIYYVKDNGSGFDMDYSNKLFAVFQRLHSPEQFQGTGVGLSIVQRIIQRHKGNVWGEGKVNEGATFYFTIGKSS